MKADAIKKIYTNQIINCNTLKEIGFVVKLELNSSYTYLDSLLSEIKKIIKARNFFFAIIDRKICVTFICHYNGIKSNIKKSLV